MTIQHYALHSFCKAFRRADAREKDEIVARMRSHGYDGEQPITLYEGQILDGGTRYDAALEAEVEPTYTVFNGNEDEAIALVVRRNKRKHTIVGQLDLGLARLVIARHDRSPGRGSNNSGTSDGRGDGRLTCATKTAELVAKEGGRGGGTVMKARDLILHAAPNIVAMVEAGELATTTAADGVRRKTRDEQAQMTATDVRGADGARDKRRYESVKPARARTSIPATPTRPHTHLTRLDIGEERIFGQPVQLWPARVQRLQEAGIRVSGIAARVEFLAKVDTEGCVEDLRQLLAYQPVAGKKNGEERDFAREARKSLAAIEQHIENAIERLIALRAGITSRRNDTSPQQEHSGVADVGLP